MLYCKMLNGQILKKFLEFLVIPCYDSQMPVVVKITNHLERKGHVNTEIQKTNTQKSLTLLPIDVKLLRSSIVTTSSAVP